MSVRLLVVGGGNMGTAIVRGLLGARRDPESIAIVETDPVRRSALAGELPEIAIAAEPSGAEGAVVVVKPADAEAACRALARVGVSRVLSVMAGVRLARLESWLGASTAVVRAMPNTPALVGAGASALAADPGVGEEVLSWAEEILGAVGRTVWVPESSMDAVTGLSGSGPAYVFYVAQSLIEAGTRLGLPEDVSRTLVLQTLLGSARMLLETGEPPEVLRARVTSPGGTTQAGIGVLSAHHVSETFAEAVAAAAGRSAELGT